MVRQKNANISRADFLFFFSMNLFNETGSTGTALPSKGAGATESMLTGSLLIVLGPLTEGGAFLGRRGLNRAFRDGHHITRSHHPAPFPIRGLELPHGCG